MHEIRDIASDNAKRALDRQAEEVERLHDSGAKMFRAVQLLKRKPYSQPIIHDEKQRVVINPADQQAFIIKHYESQFHDKSLPDIPQFLGDPSPLPNRITSAEVRRAFQSLNNGRAAGPDHLSGELLKYSPPIVAEMTSDILNRAIETHDPLEVGRGTLILLQKPGKPLGPLTSTRPIVLLSALRKTLSLIVLKRIQPAVDQYLATSQSAFRRGRSTSDVVWCHRWLCSMTQRFNTSIHILGIDMSKAFDTVRRDVLMRILESFLQESELRMIRILLTETWLEPRVKGASKSSFKTNIGVPQGDSLSPVLFTIYLEAALRDLRQELPSRPAVDNDLPLDIAYADDVDFVSRDETFLSEVEQQAPAVLARWNLNVNPSKTEHTTVARFPDRNQETWRTVRKLGSLLGDAEDAARRRQLAAAAFNSLLKIWTRRRQISEGLRLRLYSAYVIPVLTYNCGTWGLPMSELARMDSFHRTQLRSIIDMRYPKRISNDTLYKRCGAVPISETITRQRYSLAGHIFRLAPTAPPQLAVDMYLRLANDEGTERFRGRPRTTLVTVLQTELLSWHGLTLHQPLDVDTVRTMAADRQAWRGARPT